MIRQAACPSQQQLGFPIPKGRGGASARQSRGKRGRRLAKSYVVITTTAAWILRWISIANRGDEAAPCAVSGAMAMEGWREERGVRGVAEDLSSSIERSKPVGTDTGIICMPAEVECGKRRRPGKRSWPWHRPGFNPTQFNASMKTPTSEQACAGLCCEPIESVVGTNDVIELGLLSKSSQTEDGRCPPRRRRRAFLARGARERSRLGGPRNGKPAYVLGRFIRRMQCIQCYQPRQWLIHRVADEYW